MELALVQSPLVPALVVVPAQQHKVVQVGGATVFSVLQVVGVAERWWPGAASSGAASVSGLQGPSLGLGDRVAQGFEAADLAGRVE